MKKNPLKTLGVATLGIIGIIYLLNPTAGILELIPDAIPITGNLDEAAAVALVGVGRVKFCGTSPCRDRYA